MGGGYCLFNNVAIAALHALEQHQLERVAIVDFDVHHGNGTQAIFAEDPHVLFISVHQAGNYPLFSGERQQILCVQLCPCVSAQTCYRRL
jgi:acetoin utilization deacetylase AcuC-like enzyme